MGIRGRAVRPAFSSCSGKAIRDAESEGESAPFRQKHRNMKARSAGAMEGLLSRAV